MEGDGYKTVLKCPNIPYNNKTELIIDCAAPDEGPFYCVNPPIVERYNFPNGAILMIVKSREGLSCSHAGLDLDRILQDLTNGDDNWPARIIYKETDLHD